jgi:hypothetical protein
MSKLTDKNGVYDLASVTAITVTNDKEQTAVLHYVGGERINTLIPFVDAVKAFNPPPAEAAAPAAA